MLPEWTFTISDKNFSPIGELLDVKSSNTALILNKMRTSNFKIRLDNPLADFIVKNCFEVPIYLNAFRNGRVMFRGPFATVQEVGDSGENASLEINCVGPEFIWSTYFHNEKAEPVKFESGTEHAQLFSDLVRPLKASTKLYLEDHIRVGPTYKSSNTFPVEIPGFKTLQEVLQELSNQAAGFDWIVEPKETITENEIAELGMGDIIGTKKPNAYFEWGAGRANVSSFNHTVDISQVANLIYNVSSAGPEAPGAPTVHNVFGEGNEAEQLANIWGLREALAPLNVLNTEMRQTFVNETYQVRKRPRQTIQFEPVTDDGSGRIPQYGTDYFLGDRVPLRIVYDGKQQFNAEVRVWGIEFSTDENKNEKQKLTTSEQ